MTAAAQLALKMDADDKAIVAKAATLKGTTMAGFVRAAAREKAPLNPAMHGRDGFECGASVPDDIRRFAEQHCRRGISSVFVLADSAQPEYVLGYYTLSAAEVDGERL